MGLAAAVVGAGAIGAVGSMVAGGEQASAANNAANTQLSMYNQTKASLAPFTQAGQQSIGGLQNLLGNGTGVANTDAMMNALQNYPGYQFAQQQGNLALGAQNAAKGILYSGGQMKDAMAYNQGLASQNFNNYFNQNLSLAQLGENAGANTGAQGTLAAANAGNFMAQAGQANASGITGLTNNLTNSALQAYVLQNGMGGGMAPSIGGSLNADEANTLGGLGSMNYLPAGATDISSILGG